MILYLIQWTSAKEKFDLDKMQSFLEVLKTLKFAAKFGPPFAPVFYPSFWMSCDVVKEHVTSGFTYLACFTSVNLT